MLTGWTARLVAGAAAAVGVLAVWQAHVVVRAGAGIRSVADMRGKRISTGSPKSGTEVIANRLLRAAGLDPDTDVKRRRLDLTKSVDGMKDGSTDGLVWSGGLPTPGITDLFATHRGAVAFADVTPLLPAMRTVSPAYQRSTIPAATDRTPPDVPTIAVPNVLLVRDDSDAGTACVLTRTLFERKDDLVRANAAAAGIDLRGARDTAPVPLHRGSAAALDALSAR